MDSMIKDKLRRIENLYNTWRINENMLKRAIAEGKRSSLMRSQVFLKENIKSLLKEAMNEMNPRIFEVTLIEESSGDMITKLMVAETQEEIDLYIHLVRALDQAKYKVLRIQEIPTMYKQTQTNLINHEKEREVQTIPVPWLHRADGD